MKKFILLTLMASLALSFQACSNDDGNPPSDDAVDDTVEADADDTTDQDDTSDDGDSTDPIDSSDATDTDPVATTGSCSDPSIGYDIRCESISVCPNIESAISDPSCCQYYMEADRDWCEPELVGDVRATKQIIVGPQEICRGNPEISCSDFSFENCPTDQGCTKPANRDICIGFDGAAVEVTCSRLDDKDMCNAFGCDWTPGSAD
jgi:hypothetical protein